MKVFISWSGRTSHNSALALQDWFRTALQALHVYVSSKDIDKGARWGSEIASELEDASCGILCLSRDNLDAPWIMFEAGALSKNQSTSRVTPLLLGLKPHDIKGPLEQFQATKFERDDFFQLLRTLNSLCEEQGLDEQTLEKVYATWWPNLERDIEKILGDGGQDEGKDPDDRILWATILDELSGIKETLREQIGLLRSPGTLFPSYLADATNLDLLPREHPIWKDVYRAYLETESVVAKTIVAIEQGDQVDELSLDPTVQRLGEMIRYALRHSAGTFTPGDQGHE